MLFPTLFLNSQTIEEKAIIEKLGISKFYLNNSHFGKDFWVSFHQTWGFYDSEYRIFVLSLKNTSVTVELPSGTNKITKQVIANETTVFTSKKSEINITWSGNESELVTPNGLHVFSDDPILVYVYISSKDYAGEGYLALPVSAWGSEYYSFSYYDYRYPGNGMNHPGGFVVIGSEDKTKVTIELKGAGKGLAKTKAGHNIGDVLNCELNAGETYLVTGDAKTNGGLFDLTGSRITANKPVAVVSFHEFSCITHLCDNFGNYFSEMLLPTSTWGKKYYSVMFTRTGNFGDFFRVIGSENNTPWKCKYYDIKTNKQLGNMSSTLKNQGDFFEWYQGGCGSIPAIRGLAKWESDKPFMVMQYAYSHMWDGDLNWQPVMIQLASEEQYIKPVVFLAPGNFPSEMNLLAVGDTNDKNSKLLKSIKLDGEQLTNKAPSIVYNNIPGTNIFWVKLNVEVGMHTLEGDTKFAGYLARSRPASFGWYIGMGLNRTDEKDSLPPVIIISGSCGDFTVDISELQNGKPFPEQKDQGISKIVTLDELNSNFSFEMQNPELFKPQLKMTKQRCYFKVIDRSKSAKAYFAVLDRAGNMVIDSVSYEADNLSLSTSCIDFGPIRTFSQKKQVFSITNNNSGKMILSSKLTSEHYSVEDLDSVITLQAGETKNFKMTYFPETETKEAEETDTLYLQTECNSYYIVVKGHGVTPKISVEDYDFGTVEKGFTASIESINNLGFIIRNPGSDSLNVFGIDNVKPPFELSTETEPSFPFKLAPSGAVALKSVIFNPQDSGTYLLDITVKSDGMFGDSVSTLTGKGKIKVISVEEINSHSEPEIQVIPNPTGIRKVKLIINLNQPTELKINIFDNNAKYVSNAYSDFVQQGNFTKEISLENLPHGIYFINVVVGKYTRTVKVEIM